MARLARIVIPAVAHHVTQRGNADMETLMARKLGPQKRGPKTTTKTAK